MALLSPVRRISTKTGSQSRFGLVCIAHARCREFSFRLANTYAMTLATFVYSDGTYSFIRNSIRVDARPISLLTYRMFGVLMTIIILLLYTVLCDSKI